MTKELDDIVAAYERANRIFSGLQIKCHMVSRLPRLDLERVTDLHGPVAWSHGLDICFAQRVVKDARGSLEAKAALAGLNFHELGHVLYTPTINSWLRGKLSEQHGLQQAFNALEDQRIETLLAAQYPALAGYFVHAFRSFVVDNTQSVYTSHLLAHGRQFLPEQLRQVLSNEFVGTWDERDEAAVIIDEYRTLILGPEESEDAERALDLVHRFQRIIQDLGEGVPSRVHGIRFGGATTTVMQIDAQQARALIENGHHVLDVVTSPAPIRRQRRPRPRRCTSRRPPMVTTVEDNKTITTVPVPTAYVDAARRFRIELVRLRGDADAGWVRQQSSGRLNTQRVLLNADAETVFDRWEAASFEATDIDAVLLLDASGSMRSAMGQVCAAAWAIKRAIETVGGQVSVYSYADGPGIVYRRSERAAATTMRRIQAAGGNEPLAALKSARQALARSRATNRMLITLADGDWGYAEDAAHDEIDLLRSDGVMTAVGLLGEYAGDDPHHHEHAARLSAPACLVTMARELVRSPTLRRTAA